MRCPWQLAQCEVMMNKCSCDKTPASEPSGVGGRGGRAMPRLGWGGGRFEREFQACPEPLAMG